MPSNGSLPCVLMCQTRENRWSDIMAIIVMSVAVNGKKENQDEWVSCILDHNIFCKLKNSQTNTYEL